jgi:hypothetical protein
MTGNGRVIVRCTHGEEDLDRVVVACLTAGSATAPDAAWKSTPKHGRRSPP